MKLLVTASALLLLSGCAPFEEAYYADREFGQASRKAWDAQVLHPDYPFAEQTAEGLPGITAEEVTDVRNKTFAEKSKKLNILKIGLSQ